MDKKQAFAFLAELEKEGIFLGLGRIRKFLRALGNPEKEFRAVHVAGTNGKGSTAAMLESILRKAGYRTGLYISPHLVRVNERFLVNGREIAGKRLVELVAELKLVKEREKIRLTHFEFLTALAFLHFARSGVDFAVVEVGMGGRLDATNVLRPGVSVITNVEREHEEFLGKAVGKIAGEKAGVIKKRVPVVTAEWKKPVLRVLRRRAVEKGSRLVVVSEPFAGKLPLLGSFQRWNAAAAVAAAGELGEQGFEVGEKAVRAGLAAVRWPGRFEVVQRSPLVVLDCCHNPSSAVVLARAFGEVFPGKAAVLMIGVSSDKNIAGIAKVLAPIAARVVATEAKYRAMPARAIKRGFEKRGKRAEIVLGVGMAVKKAISLAGKEGVVLVCGSCFVVGEAMQALGK